LIVNCFVLKVYGALFVSGRMHLIDWYLIGQ